MSWDCSFGKRFRGVAAALGGERYKEQARRMLRNMIDQHRNHPSVIIWGIGNENDWPGDFEDLIKTRFAHS